MITTVVQADPAFKFRNKAECESDRGIAWAWAEVRRQFPGVRDDVIYLLLAAKGVAQQTPSKPPRIFLSGQSGATKTTHCYLAADIGCDRLEKLRFTTDLARYAQGIASRSERATFVLTDEIAKVSCKPDMIADALIGVHAGAPFWQLYRGTKSIVNPGVQLYADTVVPDAFRNNVQLARRVVHVEIGAGLNSLAGVDWRKTCNTGDVRGWRSSRIFPDNAIASDMIVSECMDAFFTEPRPFEDIAADLGFSTFANEKGDGADVNADLREFFDVVCATPDTDLKRWKGRGWKTFDPTHETSLAKAWSACVRGDNRQRLTGARWGDVVGVPGVEIDLSEHGKIVGVRFRYGSVYGRARFNDEIRTEAA